MSARRSFDIALVVLVLSLPIVHAAAKHAAETAPLPKTHAVGYFNGIALTDTRSSCERTKRLAIRDSAQSGCWNRDSETTVSIIWLVPTSAGIAFKPRRYDRTLFMKPAAVTPTKPASAGLIGS